MNNTEERQVSPLRRHGNGLLDRLATRAMPNGARTPAVHVRNRWSNLKPGLATEFSHLPPTIGPTRVGA